MNLENFNRVRGKSSLNELNKMLSESPVTGCADLNNNVIKTQDVVVVIIFSTDCLDGATQCVIDFSQVRQLDLVTLEVAIPLIIVKLDACQFQGKLVVTERVG